MKSDSIFLSKSITPQPVSWLEAWKPTEFRPEWNNVGIYRRVFFTNFALGCEAIVLIIDNITQTTGLITAVNRWTAHTAALGGAKVTKCGNKYVWMAYKNGVQIDLAASRDLMRR